MLFVLEIQSQGIDADVFLNQVKLAQVSQHESKSFQTKINQWVINGNNEVTIRVLSVPDKGAQPILRVKLIKGQQGVDPGDAGIIYSYDFANHEGELPADMSYVIKLQSHAGEWAWQRAEKTVINESSENEIMAFLEQLRGDVAGRQKARVIEAFSLKHQELAKSLSVPVDRINEGFGRQLDGFFDSNDWHSSAFSRANVRFELEAQGKIIRVSQKDGSPLIWGSGGNGALAMPVMMSKINGRWVIVH